MSMIVAHTQQVAELDRLLLELRARSGRLRGSGRHSGLGER